MAEYLLNGQLSELERLQLQSRVWEPAGMRVLDEIGSGTGKRSIDVGCGCLGWLRVLNNWVGPTGTVIGADVDESMLDAASSFVETERLSQVELVNDDLFRSALPTTFDLVHARFQIAPLGRAVEQVTAYRQLLAPGGVLVLEDPDASSWRFNPAAPATERLIELIVATFEAAGGDFNAGRIERDLLAEVGIEPHLRAEVVALQPGHPYLRLPLQFAAALRLRLTQLVSADELDEIQAVADEELSSVDRWGTTFTLVQTWGGRRDESATHGTS